MKHGILKRIVVCSLLAFAASACLSRIWAQDGGENQNHLSAQEWREDLHYLAEQMPLKHKQLFHTMSREEFNAAVEKLDADIPQLNDDQIFVRLAQILALVQDGHSGFDLRPIPPPDRKDRIPIRFDRYENGIYVRAAAPEYADAVGGKVIKIGSDDWEPAIQKVDSIDSHDAGNLGEQFAWGAKTTLNCPRLLHGLGLSSSGDAADFVIEKNGSQRTFHMKASAPMGPWFLNSIPSDWVDARPSTASVPLSRQHEDMPYWFTALPDQHTVYFQFNLILPIGNEGLDAFSKRLATALQAPEIDRLVIDLRNNTGGDNTLIRNLLVTLIRSKQNHRGGIYVLTGPATFSATQNFLNRLGNYADIVVIGAPTAENVNFFGDPVGILLPHSHLEAAVSTLWWQDEDPRDKRTATFPELAVADTFNDYVAGRDPVLELAMKTPTPLGIEDVLTTALPHGLQPAVAAYQQYVNDPVHKYLPDPENKVNSLGYQCSAPKKSTMPFSSSK